MLSDTRNVNFKMSKTKTFTYIKTLVLICCLFCEVSSTDKSKNNTIFSRLLVEEIDNNTISKNVTDFVQDHLVSFMVKNVKDIFGSEDKITDDPDDYILPSIITLTVSSTVDSYDNASELNSYLSQNISSDEVIQKNVTEEEMTPHVSRNKNTESYESVESDDESNSTGMTSTPVDPISKRSCIFCDNVASNNCVDPKSKLVPMTECELADDMCYSMHTPFGVIERGCYNVNHNLTTYVCTCNLCNHIPIGELPYMFSNKKDWLQNVIELTRVKRLRQSILKEMACLRCEVNGTADPKHLIDDTYCFEGKIGPLPTQECKDDEICGIKSIKSEGYIWRGCLKSPLYNYWWKFCDSDLCNYDILTSIYDPV